ncbi:NB-ARC domain-containing protein [Lentzea sp. NPDC006480]|uniref:ATP-binding protein n=1 Tax=Lentzea sp. NPDC006480 TaxID=3157176 RepID=UPI0033B2553D
MSTTFGELLRTLRLRIPMTQEELSHRTGITVRAICNMERGQVLSPRRRNLELLAAALNLQGHDITEFMVLARGSQSLPESDKGDLCRPTVAMSPQSTTPSANTCALPPVFTELTGRECEQKILDEFMTTARSSPSMQVAVIHGPPGVGKSALAVDAGHRLGHLFTDGCLFLDLRGTSVEPMPAERAAHQVLHGFGVDEREIPSDADGKLALYHSVLRHRSVLIVLDNALSESQVRPLLPAGLNTKVLVTSRSTLSGLVPRSRLALGPLGKDCSVTLLRNVAGEDRVRAEPAAAERIAEICGGFPLALLISANRLTTRPKWTIAHFADQLEDERRRLSVLTAGDVQVRTAFEISYQQLKPAAAALFRRLVLIPSADVSVELACVVTGQPEQVTSCALDDLVDANMISSSEKPGRYTLHDLLRVFAVERLELDEEPAAVWNAGERVRRWLLAVATKATRLFGDPAAGTITIDGPDPVHDRDSADRWLTSELEHWRGALRTASALGEHERVLTLTQSLQWYAYLRGSGELWREVFQAGADAAQRLGDIVAEAQQLNSLSWVLNMLCGQPHEALAVHEHAVEKAIQTDHLPARAWSELFGAEIQWKLGQRDEAMARARAAAELFEHAQDHTGLFLAISVRGMWLTEQNRHEEAATAHHLCITFQRATASLPVNDEILAVMLRRYGQYLIAIDDFPTAFSVLEEAESLFRKHDVAHGVASVAVARGHAFSLSERWKEATAELVTALHVSPLTEIRIQILMRLAEVATSAGDPVMAREHRIQALTECHSFDTIATRKIAEKLEAELGFVEAPESHHAEDEEPEA